MPPPLPSPLLPLSAPAEPTLGASADTSRLKGDDSTGELVLAVLMLPRLLAPPSPEAREEFLGETLPVCCKNHRQSASMTMMKGEEKEEGMEEHTCFAHLSPQLLHRSRFPLGPLLHSGVSRL
jgi:hypothetical protein